MAAKVHNFAHSHAAKFEPMRLSVQGSSKLSSNSFVGGACDDDDDNNGDKRRYLATMTTLMHGITKEAH